MDEMAVIRLGDHRRDYVFIAISRTFFMSIHGDASEENYQKLESVDENDHPRLPVVVLVARNANLFVEEGRN